MFDFTGRVAVVTGGGTGLGESMAKALARQGADIAIAGRRMEKLEEVAEVIRAIGVRCLTVQTDVTREEDRLGLVGAVHREFGKADVLVNNAGNGTVTKAEEMPTEAFVRDLELNLIGPFALCREFAKGMIVRGYGRIINIASVSALLGHTWATISAYNSAKAGLVGMTRQLGAEWAMKGVTVNTVCPGWFLSEVTASTAANEEFLEKVVKAWCPMQRWAEPKELDPAIIFMASAENSYMTGVTFAVDGGYSAV